MVAAVLAIVASTACSDTPATDPLKDASPANPLLDARRVATSTAEIAGFRLGDIEIEKHSRNMSSRRSLKVFLRIVNELTNVKEVSLPSIWMRARCLVDGLVVTDLADFHRRIILGKNEAKRVSFTT